MVAYSIGSYRAQIPVGDRKSGMPLSVEIPAPVSTTQGCRSWSKEASSLTAVECRVMADFRFSTDVRVRFAETDAQGVAHNSNYLVWFEIARIAYLEEFAGGYPALRETGLESFVLESHVRYRLPAHFDDRLQIHARVGELRGARFRFDYEVTRGAELIADGWTSHACVDAKTLRPTRIPQALADAISKAESSSTASSASSTSTSSSSTSTS
jgi:acyl-CoA thioester hydrolase